MENEKCRRCGLPVVWTRENGQWVPVDPFGELGCSTGQRHPFHGYLMTDYHDAPGRPKMTEVNE